MIQHMRMSYDCYASILLILSFTSAYGKIYFLFNFFDSLVYFNRFIINFLQTKNLRKLVLKKICKLLRV